MKEQIVRCKKCGISFPTEYDEPPYYCKCCIEEGDSTKTCPTCGLDKAKVRELVEAVEAILDRFVYGKAPRQSVEADRLVEALAAMKEAIKEIQKQLKHVKADTASNPTWVAGAKYGLEFALKAIEKVMASER